MILKKNILISLYLILSSSIVNAEFSVVSYGWELFERVSDARTVSLSYSTIAYPFGSNGTSIINPAIILNNKDKFGITHQSKIAGTVNSEFLSFKKKIRPNVLIDISLLYEGISDIPDTRNVLLDWGEDGIFGTFDPGEGNGTLDDGERLDIDKIKYFSQKQFGIHSGINKPLLGGNIGVGVKFLLHLLGDNYAMGAGLDFGYFRRFNKTNIGLVLYNIPSSGLLWDNGNTEVSKSTMALGINREIFFKKYSLKFNPMFKIHFLGDNKSLDSYLLLNQIFYDINSGLEISFKDKLFFRISRIQSGAISSGIGASWTNLGFDYAFVKDTSPLGIDNNHLISINVSLLWIKNKIFDKNLNIKRFYYD